MLRTYIYVPDDLDEKVKHLAKHKGVSKAKVIRDALEHGLSVMNQNTQASLDAMVKIAEIGKKYNIHGPKDASKNLDKYLWDNYEV